MRSPCGLSRPRRTPRCRSRKGGNGVSTNGSLQKLICLSDCLGTNLSKYIKICPFGLFPQSVKTNYFSSYPISLDPIRTQPEDEEEDAASGVALDVHAMASEAQRNLRQGCYLSASVIVLLLLLLFDVIVIHIVLSSNLVSFVLVVLSLCC